jgi:hypothetical protein
MTDGNKLVAEREYRPVTALTVSWMQRNDVFNDKKDMIWRASAFAFLHSEPLPAIRAVVNEREDFSNAVDSWIEKNITHHLSVVEMSKAMNSAFDLYMSAASELATPKASAPGN